MSKIAIISQPDQGVLIDVSGCTTLQEALEHLNATLQVSSQFWKGMSVSLNLGKLDLATRDVAQILALTKGVGIAPKSTFSQSELTKSSLKEMGLQIGLGEPMSLPKVSFHNEEISDAEVDGEKKKKSPFASIKLRVADALNSRKASQVKPPVEEPVLEDMESVGGPLRDPFDTSPLEKDPGEEIVPQASSSARVKTSRRVTLDGKKYSGKGKDINATTQVSSTERKRGPEPTSSDSDIQASIAAHEASSMAARATLVANPEMVGGGVTPIRTEASEVETSEGITGAPYVVDSAVESKEFISLESSISEDLVATESDDTSDALSEIEEFDGFETITDPDSVAPKTLGTVHVIDSYVESVSEPVESIVQESVVTESVVAESGVPEQVATEGVAAAPVVAAVEPAQVDATATPEPENTENFAPPDAKAAFDAMAKQAIAKLETTADVTETVQEISAATADSAQEIAAVITAAGAQEIAAEITAPAGATAAQPTAAQPITAQAAAAQENQLEQEWDEDQETDEEFSEQEPKVPSPTVNQSTLYIKQTLRSGQTVSHKGHLIIVGDINPGAEVMAEGDITVWGTLRGVAHAGVGGNVGAEIRALKLQPIQIRIANAIARAPDRPRSKNATNVSGPETARMVGGKIRVFRSRLD